MFKINITENAIDFLKKMIPVYIIFHLIAVFFSEGYHRPDEHLGIIRLVFFKLGLFPENELSWEFPAQIRPWLQPALYYNLTKIINLLGITDPFFIIFSFRLISSILGMHAYFLFHRDFILKNSFNNTTKNIATLFLVFMWFLPFFHARSSAENLGITFFLYGLVFLNRVRFRKLDLLEIFAVGSFFAISFIVRFQMGFMVFSTMIWYLVKKRIKILPWTLICILMGATIGLSVFIDYWGYGNYTFTPWNYYYQNIVNKMAAGFGVSPWYYYFTKTLTKGIPPISLFYIIPFFWIWIKKPMSLFTWVTLPYLIIHSIVGHKELRFIFALSAFIPWAIAIFYRQYPHFPKKGFKVLFSVNLIALLIASIKPAFSEISFYKYLWNQPEKIEKIYTLGVFRDQLKVYLKNPIEQIVTEQSKINSISKDKVMWFLADKSNDRDYFDEKDNCHQEYLSYPKWLLNKSTKKYFKRSKVWALYRCSFD